MKIKTNFKKTDLENAVTELYKARLIGGWTGCLKLETNKHHIILSQYPSSSTWRLGYKTIAVLDDWFDWGDIEGFYLRDDGRVEIESDEGTEKGEFYDNVEIVDVGEAFDRLVDAGFLEAEVECAYQAMREVG